VRRADESAAERIDETAKLREGMRSDVTGGTGDAHNTECPNMEKKGLAVGEACGKMDDS
jgi:hypothetical protein